MSGLFGNDNPVPPAPDYTGATEAQAKAAQEAATAQNYANRPTQNTPFGSQFWTTGQQTDPATGQPVTTWTQNQQLDPAIQGALNDQLQIQAGRSDLAGGFMGRVGEAYANPFDWTNLPGMAQTPDAQLTQGRQMQSYLPAYQLDTSAPQQTTQAMNEPAFAAQRQQLEQAMLQRLAPMQQQQREQLDTQLANQGFTRGNNAYGDDAASRAARDLGDQHSRDQYNALMNATSQQQSLQQMMLAQQQQAFGQDAASQAARNQALGQQQAQYGQAGQFFNQAQGQMFGQDLSANAQNQQQMMQQAEYQNRLRQQGISEQQMARSQPLNEMQALLSGQQVQSPQMPGFMSAQGAQAPNYLQAAMAQGQYGLGGAQLGAAQNAGMWGGLGTLGAGLAATSDKWWPALFGGG